MYLLVVEIRFRVFGVVGRSEDTLARACFRCDAMVFWRAPCPVRGGLKKSCLRGRLQVANGQERSTYGVSHARMVGAWRAGGPVFISAWKLGCFRFVAQARKACVCGKLNHDDRLV
ncbi:unnamed protein product [Ectocarpus sp. 8 AP-2014]